MKKAIEKNIFEEINRTIELKNKLTVAKNNINEVIVRGGGVRSEDLNGIPQNIHDMVNKYSKIAMGETSVRDANSLNFINTNLNFNPKRVIAIVTKTDANIGTGSDVEVALGVADSTINYSHDTAFNYADTWWYKGFWIENISSKGFNLQGDINLTVSKNRIIWLAIG